MCYWEQPNLDQRARKGTCRLKVANIHYSRMERGRSGARGAPKGGDIDAVVLGSHVGVVVP